MRFAIFHVPTSTGPDDDRAVIDLTIEQSLLADELGFSAIFFPEHHFTNYSPMGSDPFAMAAYLAPQLRQAWLGFAIVVAPLNHPVRIVERCNLIDQLTRGRALFAIGSGFHAVEFMGLGLHPDEAKSGLADRVVDTALDLWDMPPDGAPFSFEVGPYKGTVLNRVMPAPYSGRRPHLMGTSVREAGTIRAATQGWPVFYLNTGDPKTYDDLVRRVRLYRETLVAAGHSAETVAHCLDWSSSHSILTVVAETDAQAEREAAVALEGHKANLERQQAWIVESMKLAGLEPPATPRFDPLSRNFKDFACLIGSPDTVARKLRPLHELGIGLANMSFNLGMPQDRERRRLTDKWMRLFAAEVMPQLAGQPSQQVDFNSYGARAQGRARDIEVTHVV